MKRFYIAGPMTGIPQFNFPAFIAAAKRLRELGFNVVSPHELEGEDAEAAMRSKIGDLTEAKIEKTWGDFLARDVKLIADECAGVVFLPGWERSRGARLEAFVAVLCAHDFALYDEHFGMVPVEPTYVKGKLL